MTAPIDNLGIRAITGKVSHRQCFRLYIKEYGRKGAKICAEYNCVSHPIVGIAGTFPIFLMMHLLHR